MASWISDANTSTISLNQFLVSLSGKLQLLMSIGLFWHARVKSSNFKLSEKSDFRTLPIYTVLNYPTTIPYCSPVTLRRPGREHWEMDAKQQLRQVRGWKGDQTGLNTLKKNGSWTAPFCKTSNFDIQHGQLKIVVIMQGPKHCSLP